MLLSWTLLINHLKLGQATTEHRQFVYAYASMPASQMHLLQREPEATCHEELTLVWVSQTNQKCKRVKVVEISLENQALICLCPLFNLHKFYFYWSNFSKLSIILFHHIY